MQALVSAFGIDWRLLLIDGINFGLLLLALWYFLYGPLTKMLESRREKIVIGVRDAVQAAKLRAEIEASRGEILSAAGTEADELLKQARVSALEKAKQIVVASEASAAAVVKDAEAAAQELKAEAIASSKAEVAKLIVLGMEKLSLNK
jgi:F-type H+-transporting ATPase subunit b